MKKTWSSETVTWERRVFTFEEVCELLGFEEVSTDYVELKIRQKETSCCFHLNKKEMLIMSRRLIVRTGSKDEE